MDGHETRSKRGLGLGLASAALTSFPGMGWASLGVGVVVVGGITAYSVLSSRLDSTNDQVEELRDKSVILQANQHTLKQFAESAKLDINQLAVKHNLLSDAFTDSQILIPKLIAFAAEITSRLTIRGEQLENGIHA